MTEPDPSNFFPPIRPQRQEVRRPTRKKTAAAPKKKTAKKKAPAKRPPRTSVSQALYDPRFPGSHPDYPPPAFLSTAAKGKWVEIVPVLLERADRSGQKLLDPVTRDSLAIFCDAWGQFDQACRIANSLRSPFIVVGNGALQPHPAYAFKKAAWAEIRNSAKLLGLNPISRQQLKAKKTGAVDLVSQIVG